MGSRLIPSAATIHPWPFPVLDGAARPAPAPIDEAAAPPPEAAAPCVVPEPIAVAPVDPEAAALAEERQAHGYAEGLRRGLEEGRERGYADGRAAAQATEERLADQASRLVAIIDRLGAPIAALQRPVEEAIVALALEIARCVIGGEVARSRDYLVRLIGEAVSKVPIEMGAPKVLLNPADLEIIRGLAPELDKSGAVLIADEAIEEGGCLVVADGDGEPVEDRRWHPRAGEGVSQVNLTLSSRWRAVLLALFDTEGE